MPTIESLFLAEYIKLTADATMTAVGVGVRGMIYPVDEEEVNVAVGLTIAREVGDEGGTLTLTLDAPEGAYSVSQSMELDPVSGDGEFALTVFSVHVPIPLAGAGRYIIRASVGSGADVETSIWLKPASDADGGE